MSGDSEKQKLEAALEQLEAEQRRRVEEKIEKGHAVPGIPFVIGGVESIADWKHPTHDSDGREIVFGPDDPQYIITGVPRADRDAGYCARLQREYEREDYAVPNKPLPHQPGPEGQTTALPPLPKPTPEPEKPPEPRYIYSEVRERSNDPVDAGEIVEGYYDVKGGVVFVWNKQDSSPIGNQAVAPGDDVKAVARRILREKSGKALGVQCTNPISKPFGALMAPRKSSGRVRFPDNARLRRLLPRLQTKSKLSLQSR